MSPTTLSLFPSPDLSMSRKTSYRTRSRAANASADNGQLSLRGVAFQVVTPSQKTAHVQPAADTIKHSLFCSNPAPDMDAASTIEGPDSVKSPDVSSAGAPDGVSLLRRQSRTRRKSGMTSTNSAVSQHASENTTEDDQLAALPHNASFSSTTPPRMNLSIRSRIRSPQNLSTVVQPDHAKIPITPTDEKNDRVSPLPSKTKFTPPRVTYPPEKPSTQRSGSPVPSKSSSPPEAHRSPMRSMFPVYDPSKPMDRQNYYPSPTASPPPAYLGNNVSKMGSPVERQNLKRLDSVVGMLDGYEHVPAAAHGDMEALWKASREEYPVAGRKVQFGLYQPTTNGKALAIGTSQEDLIYCMERDHTGGQYHVGHASKQFAVRKHCPIARSIIPVATIAVPDQSNARPTNKSSRKDVTEIFPHAAAMHAIEAALGTPEASHIATFDPTAQSPEAASLAQMAVAEAHRRYCCELIKRTRKRDSLGAVTAHYELAHPILGTCPVTVTKSQSTNSRTGPRAKISFHHPSATPAAVAADTLNLAFIDFAHDACVLDVPGLLALDSHYIMDTVISTLLAVAVIENDALVADALVFDAPPKTPVVVQKPKAKSKSKREARRASRALRRSGTEKGKQVEEVVGEMEQVELGGVAKGVLAVMELTFKASAWVIILGAKVGLGVVGYGVDKIQQHSSSSTGR